MTSTRYIELFWDCPECKTPHISAVFNPHGNRCPHCFYYRDTSVLLYEAPDSKEITDPALIQKTQHPQWICKVCGSVNDDEGLAANLLQCGNCDSYQVDPVSASAPDVMAAGKTVEAREHIPASRFENVPSDDEAAPASSAAQSKRKSGLKRWAMGLTAAGLLGGGGLLFWGDNAVEVQVEELNWTVAVAIEEKQPTRDADWAGAVPSDATILSRDRRQRTTREVQEGTKVIQVAEEYQSGMRNEQYQESERYQSGSKEECKTTTTGTGIGKKTCSQVPVYSTRQVTKTRQVPVYSTRMVNQTVPNMVTVPVFDEWVEYEELVWQPFRTVTSVGRDDEPRVAPQVTLQQVPYQQRSLAPKTECSVKGRYEDGEEMVIGDWQLPCEQFDQIDEGDRVVLELGWGDSAELLEADAGN